jgi:hypothetical protein
MENSGSVLGVLEFSSLDLAGNVRAIALRWLVAEDRERRDNMMVQEGPNTVRCVLAEC